MSILSVAYSGLSAFQRAMDVTGNNIANSASRSYSRQSIYFTPSASSRYGNSYVGTGVSVNSIYRNTDQFANLQVRNTLSVKSQYDSFYQQSLQIDKLLSQDGISISGSLQSFFDSLGQLNNAPDSISTRGVALKQSQLLVNQFNFMQSRLDEYQNTSTAQISEAVNQINQITTNISTLNQQLMSTSNAPELLDNRDELLKQLASYVDISVIDQGDGTINVALSGGDTLVAGTTQRALSIRTDQTNTSGTKVYLGNGLGEIDITTKLNGGMMGGLLDYEHNILGQASQMIGQMAIGLAQKFNAQHQLGMDMNNQIGTDYFTDYNSVAKQLSRSISSSSNTGTGVISVDLTDMAQTQLSDYDLIVSDTGTNEVRLLRKSDGTSTTLNWTSSPPAPPAGQIVIDGMTLTVDDTSNLVNNDHFTLVPLRGAARDLGLEITDYREMALASPVRTQASMANTGTGQIVLGPVINTSAVSKEFRIDFISETQYNLVNVTDSTSTGPLAFTPGSENTIQIPDALNPSYSIVLSGLPKTGDSFTSEYNAGGTGDNRNGLALAGIQQEKFFSGGSESLFDRYSNLLSQVGSQTNQAKIRADSADVLNKQAIDFQGSKSGVNLDEEGANLLRFKQAYEAAGKLMEISSQMMNLLFEIMR